ncbi:hypothetical protein CcCBS67573_g06361 [Chytriomyces confervae]|uniref:Uncharacterized protein n=1 Tax=Chytriomyces confervae TaxID=246404 RepID=A0A507F4C9_9FUNG|nr:hypothetical protein CcCBS67573_g06361 [Chytriomyces confervae]
MATIAGLRENFCSVHVYASERSTHLARKLNLKSVSIVVISDESRTATSGIRSTSGVTTTTTTTTATNPNTAHSESEAATLITIQPVLTLQSTAVENPQKLVSAAIDAVALFGALRLREADAVQASEVPMEYQPDQSVEGHILYPSVPVAPSAPTMIALDDNPPYPSHSTEQYLAEHNEPTANMKSEYAQSIIDRELETLPAEAINTPSAPPIHLMLNEAVPLDDAVLANMYANAELQNQYATILDDFRKSANTFSHAIVSLRMFSSSNAHFQRFNPRPLDSHLTARCEDGVHLVHIVSSETVHLNRGELEKLRETLTTALADCIYAKKRAAFEMKMMKLWMQTYLDEHLIQLDKALSTASFEELDSVKASTDASFKRLKYFLDVLFFFKRRKDSSDPAWHPPNDATWSDRFLDAYLTNFHIFLSPIEKTQDEQRVKDIENEFIVKSLRKLEELEEWVVIKEGEVIYRDMVNANWRFYLTTTMRHFLGSSTSRITRRDSAE